MAGDGYGTVLITGASRGLGAALALAFAREGAPVAICARGGEALERVADAVRRLGGPCVARALDVTDEEAVEDWVGEAGRELGTPRVLVNNASVLGPRTPLADLPVASWREAIEVNLTGTFLATRAALPAMLHARTGSIVNVSSGAAVPPRADWGPYAVSKAAVEAFSLNLAHELEGTGVRVNVVDPGAMRTPMRAAAYPEEDSSTLPTPEEATGVFLWLAGDESRHVTGQRLRAGDWAQRLHRRASAPDRHP